MRPLFKILPLIFGLFVATQANAAHEKFPLKFNQNRVFRQESIPLRAELNRQLGVRTQRYNLVAVKVIGKTKRGNGIPVPKRDFQ